MKIVFLTSGPRGAGKTGYTHLVKKNHPEVKIISRDEILIELFGDTSLDPYTGDHQYGAQVIEERLGKVLSKNKNCKVIFDCWNGFSSHRKGIIETLREFGADRIICWQFVTPLDDCIKWFLKKPDAKGYSEYSCRRDYATYHRTALDIGEDGFDAILRINPRQLSFPGFPLI